MSCVLYSPAYVRTLRTMEKAVPKLFLGEGAEQMAREHAKTLLGAPPAGHPDLFAVTPEGASIRIDQLREAIWWTRYAPVRAPHRVVLIGPAERLSHEAASALLKSLEEAPAYLTFILYASSPDHLLPTVRSRCALVWAEPPRELWRKKLHAAGYTDQEIDFLLEFIQNEEDIHFFTEARRVPRSEWEEAKREVDGLPLLELADRFCACAADPIRRRVVAAAIAMQLPNSAGDEILLAAERLARGGREAALTFLRELLHFLLRDAPQGAFPVPPERLAAWAKKVSLARGELEANVNVKLLLEVILLWPKKG